MSSVSSRDILLEFRRSKIGLVGIGILAILIGISISAIVFIPVETFQEWNNPSSWISFPKTSIPVWVNWFPVEKIPEHKIIEPSNTEFGKDGEISVSSHKFGMNFNYDDFPNDFIYEFSAHYSGSPLLQFSVIRPDGIQLELLSMSLPFSSDKTFHNERIFSTDDSIKKKLSLENELFEFPIDGLSAEDIVFFKIGITSSSERRLYLSCKFVWNK